MRKAEVLIHDMRAGELSELPGHRYTFGYDKGYAGPSISLSMPVREEEYVFDQFPAFFEGLLPEGMQLEGLLQRHKIDHNDFFQQLVVLGSGLVGAVTVFDICDHHE